MRKSIACWQGTGLTKRPGRQCVRDATVEMGLEHRLCSCRIAFEGRFQQLLMLARGLFASIVEGKHLISEISIEHTYVGVQEGT